MGAPSAPSPSQTTVRWVEQEREDRQRLPNFQPAVGVGCPCSESAFSIPIPPIEGTSTPSQELCWGGGCHPHSPALTPAAKETPISGTAEKTVGEKSANSWLRPQ